jgi:hypothetical protein
MSNSPEFRTPDGRWDAEGEMLSIMVRSLAKAALAEGLGADTTERLVHGFFSNFAARSQEARQLPTGPDGLPV